MSALPRNAAIVVLGPSAFGIARRIKAILPDARIHATAGPDADVVFGEGRAGDHLRQLFSAGTPVLGLCASGILVRALSPLVADKRVEPPVVAVAEDGSVVVPILGGHRGANALARAVAAMTGGVAAITTAGDLRFDWALDEPPPGWRVANPERAKPVTAALLGGEAVALRIEAGDAAWLRSGGAPFTDHGNFVVRITDRAVEAGEEALVLHPPVLVLGVGCERGVAFEEMRARVTATLASHGLAPGAVALIASIDLKADEPAIQEVAESLGVPARFFSAAELLAQTERLHAPSEAVFRAVGCYGVAEGAALAAVGAEGSLVVPKESGERVTCAVARAADPLDAATIGMPRGKLAVIGIGPGDAVSRTEAARAALQDASDVVGYKLYLDLLGPALAGKQRHEGALGAEEDRVRKALDLAASGRSVALVSSGDAGIYGLASLVFELVDRHSCPEWNRIAVEVIPGVSAMQAAAAKLGAPLGHDFCAISLSDLLTPWEDIERRLKAAAAADFVIALYNPRSHRRIAQLQIAREILLGVRAADTPVAIARNLGRAGESLTLTTLDALDPSQIDMLTLLLIGNSATRRLAGRPLIYTPRGYGSKAPT